MNVAFAGTPDFAAVILRGLVDAGRRPAAVYTQPDRPAGRGRRPAASPVKRLALDLGLPVRQPATLRDSSETAALTGLAPDVLVVAAYGLILPAPVLAVPRHGCINVHASLLPRWRGAAPIQRAILAGDRETGVCIMLMEEGLDTGPVLAARPTPIGNRETGGSLHDRLAVLGRDALVQVLAAIEAGTARAVPQDDRLATYAHRIHKSELRMDWHRSAADLDRQVRAFGPAPGAWTALPGEAADASSRLRVLEAMPEGGACEAAAGVVVEARGERLRVACGTGTLRLLQVQPAGRRPMSAAQFLNGRGLARGDRLQ